MFSPPLVHKISPNPFIMCTPCVSSRWSRHKKKCVAVLACHHSIVSLFWLSLFYNHCYLGCHCFTVVAIPVVVLDILLFWPVSKQTLISHGVFAILTCIHVEHTTTNPLFIDTLYTVSCLYQCYNTMLQMPLFYHMVDNTKCPKHKGEVGKDMPKDHIGKLH